MVHGVINKILIANRGEIACRVIRTCQRMSITTVAVYSDSDENAPFVRLADEAYHLGPSVAAESYLDGDKLIALCHRAGADALHPGYGFLSENADFAQKVIDAGIVFIGPTPESIRAIGDKSAAKDFITSHGLSIPLIPGYNGNDQSVERLEKEAMRIDFPVLLKASAGGGGRGMRAVYEASKLSQEIEAAKGESLRSFGSDKLLIEKYFESIRHVEVQVFGDKHGNVYSIHERDCSIQRRHQKVVEETPSPAVDPDLRKAITGAAVELCQKLAYEGAGTVEFILDEHTKKFYFLELNTRLQVEHPITEFISGLDLVELQILVAQGANLRELGMLENIQFSGHAMEVRLCAEDPDENFSPRTGVIRKWTPATGLPGVRYDAGVEDGSEISVFYDSMIAKVVVHAPTRAEAVRRMEAALARTVLLGVTTNQRFLLNIMRNPRFRSGTFDTNFISQEHTRLFPPLTLASVSNATLAATLFEWVVQKSQRVHLRNIQPGWRNMKWRSLSKKFLFGKDVFEIEYDYQGLRQKDQQHAFTATVKRENETSPMHHIALCEAHYGAEVPGRHGIEGCSGLVRCSIDGSQHYFYVVEHVQDVNEKTYYVHDFLQGYPFKLDKVDRLCSSTGAAEDDRVTPYTSSMPCRILKVVTPTGTHVKKGDVLLSIESMKTEVKILSRHEGVVKMHVEENQVVEARVLLCQVNEVKKQ
ncbi:carbamoyl-phosphate synthase L chain, ATP binding domain-containing protein [Dichotomocladium elegans]|nr:carbamoyl-phosphate synthase L chain, ATP binding domain-containing protein [Dichotomocladium elegans]